MGEHLVLRGVRRDGIRHAYPVAVVQDTYPLIALHWRSGTRIKFSPKGITPKDMLPAGQIVLIDRVGGEKRCCCWQSQEAAHAVWVMWDEGQKSFSGWYTDLPDPLRRTSIGFDTIDRALDIVPSPNGTNGTGRMMMSLRKHTTGLRYFI